MTRTVIREWRGGRRFKVFVETRHPQVGRLSRGVITPVPSPDWRGAWLIEDHDHTPVGDGPFVGDYLDAEAALLTATAALDEEVTGDEI